ncbi:MAG: four-helix bundle copper-binding protein [Streptosporangiaceae bacterium]
MSYARRMLATQALGFDTDAGVLAATLDALSDCAQACTADVDADLSEHDVAGMITCIRLCLNCADVCLAAVGVVSRQAGADTSVARPLLEACVTICKTCGDECERHAHMHEHCRVCAEACLRAEQACRELLNALA